MVWVGGWGRTLLPAPLAPALTPLTHSAPLPHTHAQVAGGVWADRFGGKRVLGLGVVWWSLATVLTPLAARTSLPVLLAARACMGVGEGVAMPAMNNLLSK